MSSLGDAIKEARKSVWGSVKEAAEYFEVHRNSQANYESGERIPDIGYLAKLSFKCDVPLKDLIACALNDDDSLSDLERNVINDWPTPDIDKPRESHIVLDISNARSIASVRVNGKDYKKVTTAGNDTEGLS